MGGATGVAQLSLEIDGLAADEDAFTDEEAVGAGVTGDGGDGEVLLSEKDALNVGLEALWGAEGALEMTDVVSEVDVAGSDEEEKTFRIVTDWLEEGGGAFIVDGDVAFDEEDEFVSNSLPRGVVEVEVEVEIALMIVNKDGLFFWLVGVYHFFFEGNLISLAKVETGICAWLDLKFLSKVGEVVFTAEIIGHSLQGTEFGITGRFGMVEFELAIGSDEGATG